MLLRHCLLTLIVSLILSGCTRTTTVNGVEVPQNDRKMSAKAAANANINLGMQYLQERKFSQAKVNLIEALEDAPSLPACWYSMAFFLDVTGNTKLAEKYYKHAIELNERDPDSHNNYGTFLCKHKRYKEGIAQFLSTTNDVAYLDVAKSYENAGLCSMLIPDPKQAVHYFTMALKNDSNRRVAMFELARIYYHQGNVKKSRTYFNEYALLSNTNPDRFLQMMTVRQR